LARDHQTLQGGGAVGDIQAMVASYRERFGLDQPVWHQYLSYWGAVLRGDLGFSLAHYPERVAAGIRAGLPWTLGLLGFATLTSFTVGTMLGGLLGWPKASRLWRVPGTAALLLSSVPYFLIGMILAGHCGLY
jgi:peptide/nickel transport system permease protein